MEITPEEAKQIDEILNYLLRNGEGRNPYLAEMAGIFDSAIKRSFFTKLKTSGFVDVIEQTAFKEEGYKPNITTVKIIEAGGILVYLKNIQDSRTSEEQKEIEKDARQKLLDEKTIIDIQKTKEDLGRSEAQTDLLRLQIGVLEHQITGLERQNKWFYILLTGTLISVSVNVITLYKWIEENKQKKEGSAQQEIVTNKAYISAPKAQQADTTKPAKQ